jgi:predicted translin family RNA/ssDNA-binding protein
MLNKTFLNKLGKDYKTHREMRHKLIQVSNGAIRSAKQAIFSLHRQDFTVARKQLDAVKKIFQDLQKDLLKKHPELKLQGAYLAAIEEYVEAELFYQAMKTGKVVEIKGIVIGSDQYLGGMADLTGELTRQAILKATEQDYDTVDKYYAISEEIVGAMIQFDLVGHLRQKYDDTKRNLKRLESIRYDIALRENYDKK